jgi:hypothetical protein
VNKSAVPSSNKRDVGNALVKNERVKLEMEILKYRNFLLFIQDEKFRQTATEKIAELEKKIREIDE